MARVLPGNAGISLTRNLVLLALGTIVFDQRMVHPQMINGLSNLPSDFTFVVWS